MSTRHARRDDPATSKAAAATVKSGKSLDHVMWVARKVGSFTDERLVDEYAFRAALGDVDRISPQRIRSARADALRLGLVRDSGRRGRSQFDRPMTVWEVA